MNDHPRTCPNCGEDWSGKHPDAPSFSCPSCPWPWMTDPDTGFYRPNADPVRIAAKALSTVDGWVWCVMHDQPHRPQDDWIIRCTGHTHRTLLLGPEVEA